MFLIKRSEILTYLGVAFGSWLVFLASSLLLTEALMYFMDSLLTSAILYSIIGLIILSLNYLIFARILFKMEQKNHTMHNEVQKYHNLIGRLRRIFYTIVILVSLGLITSMSTFILISMRYLSTHDLSSMVQYFPFVLIIYFVFMIPSFIGIKEISILNNFISEYESLKSSLGKSIKQIDED